MGLVAVLFVGVLVLLVVLLARVSNINAKLFALEWEFRKLKGRMDELQGGGITAQPDSSKPPPVQTHAAPPIEPAHHAPPSVAPLTPAKQSVPPPPDVLPMKPYRTREEWESLIGGKILNRIGALALIIGVGFFLKYAFDNNWINETMRVLTGALAGILCLAGAYQSHKKGFQVFAQGIVGAGISILYLSVYASFNFYSLVPQWVAFLLMSAVTLITLLNALYYGSFAVALLGWAGGFLTPLMLSTGEANEIGLFSYLVLLDLGLLAIIYKKEQWWLLEPLTFAGTWILYLSWYLEFYRTEDLGVTILFVGVFWLLFFALFVLQPAQSRPAIISRQIVGGFNALFLFQALYAIIDRDFHALMSSVTMGLAAVYGAALAIRSSGRVITKQEQMHYILVAAAFLVLAPWVEWKKFETIIAWSIEAAVLVWIAGRWNLRYLWLTATGIYGLAILKFIATPGSLFTLRAEEFVLLLNLRAGALCTGAVALMVGAGILGRKEGVKDSWITPALSALWPIALFLLIGLEANDYFRQRMVFAAQESLDLMAFERLLWLGILWTLYSLPLLWIGLKIQQTPVMIGALIAALVGGGLTLVRGTFFDPISLYEPLVNIRASSFLIVTGLFVALDRLMETAPAPRDWFPDIRSALHVAIVVLVFGVATGEVRDFFRKEMFLAGEDAGERLTSLANLQQLSLSGVWLVYSAVLMTLGLWRKLRGLRIAAFVLFGITILKIFLYDLSFLETLYRIFSFVGLGLMLLAVSFAYQRYRDVIFGTKD